jgi:hypothetical protein
MGVMCFAQDNSISFFQKTIEFLSEIHNFVN